VARTGQQKENQAWLLAQPQAWLCSARMGKLWGLALSALLDYNSARDPSWFFG